MRYRNTKTGAVIDTSGEISGDNWVKLSPSSAVTSEAVEKEKVAPVQQPKKKTTRK